MKVCFVTQDLSLGGSATVVHDIISNWKNTNDKIFLITFFNIFNDRYKDLRLIKNLTIISLGKNKTIDFQFLRRLRKTIFDIKPDVISSHLTCTFYLQVVGATKICNVFHTIHSEPTKDLPAIYRLCIKSALKKQKIHLIGCCDYISSKAKKLYKVECKTIINGIDLSNSILSNKRSDSQITFLFVGRFDEVKNVPLLIRAYEQSKNTNSKLYICGFGKEESIITSLIDNSSKRNNIIFIGKTDNVDEIYQKSDVLCLVSKREGMPITVLEGIKHGLAFITSNVGGINTFVKNNFNGFCLDDVNVKTLSECFDFLCSNQDILEKFKLNSSFFKKDIDASMMSAEYQKVLYGK